MAVYDLFSLVKNIFYIILILIIFCLTYLYLNQNKMIYIPEGKILIDNINKYLVPSACTNEIKHNPINYIHPMERGMNYKEVRIQTKDKLKLYGWFIIKDKSSPTIIYFHENAGNIGMRLPYCEYLNKSLNVNILLVGYRGYGYSEGTPSEEGIMLDSEAILEYVLYNDESEISQYVDRNNLYILGRSLGGAVAIHIIHKLNLKIKGLILENTFSSMGDMVDHLFPMVKNFKRFLLKNNWPSKSKIKNVSLPILFISSSNDELVPFHHMELLYSLASKAIFKQKYIVIGGTHNESWQRYPKEYLNEIDTFFNKCQKFEIIQDIYEEEGVEECTSINKDEEISLINKN